MVAAHSADGIVAADESEGGTQESGNLTAGDQMEQEGAQTREQQGIGHIQAGQRGNQHGCAEHGEQVLHAQKQTLGGAQGGSIVDRIGIGFGSCHE